MWYNSYHKKSHFFWFFFKISLRHVTWDIEIHTEHTIILHFKYYLKNEHGNLIFWSIEIFGKPKINFGFFTVNNHRLLWFIAYENERPWSRKLWGPKWWYGPYVSSKVKGLKKWKWIDFKDFVSTQSTECAKIGTLVTDCINSATVL